MRLALCEEYILKELGQMVPFPCCTGKIGALPLRGAVQGCCSIPAPGAKQVWPRKNCAPRNTMSSCTHSYAEGK